MVVRYRYLLFGIVLFVGAATLAGFYVYGRSLWFPAYLEMRGTRTVADVIDSIGPVQRDQWATAFIEAGAAYPPRELTLLALKDSARLEVWAGAQTDPVLIRIYEIKALSGGPGPKLREGDLQVPEGIYRIEGFNPNSAYHLSMKLDFPNAFDWEQARREGRNEPGSDIFIHGKAVSIGCLAMGDAAIEELFVLVHDVGRENVQVLIAPTDPRQTSLSAEGHPGWVATLYETLETEFSKFAPDGP